MKKVSIIVPAYNEEKRIGKMLKTYLEFFERLRKNNLLNYELLVVINGTSDGTEMVVKEFQKNNPRLLFLNFKEAGKGLAILEGFKDALERDVNLIGFVDADMATPPEAFYDLIRKIDHHDGVIASRWIRKSIIVRKQNLVGQIKSKVFNFLVRSLFLFPYHDTQCGAKLFTMDAISKVIENVGITSWAFDIDLLYKLRKNGLNVVEVPTLWENMAETKVKLIKNSTEMAFAVIRLRLIHSPLAFIVRVYDSIPERFKIHSRILLS